MGEGPISAQVLLLSLCLGITSVRTWGSETCFVKAISVVLLLTIVQPFFSQNSLLCSTPLSLSPYPAFLLFSFHLPLVSFFLNSQWKKDKLAKNKIIKAYILV